LSRQNAASLDVNYFGDIMLKSLLFIVFLISFVDSPLNAEMRVGALSELSGPSAANGKACRLGYEAAERYYSQTPAGKSGLKLLYGDHRGEARLAISEFQKLEGTEEVAAVISNRGHIGMALDPISKRTKTPLLGIMGHAEFINENPFGFRFWPSPSLEGGALAEVAVDRGLKKAAMIVLHDDYILSLAEKFRLRYEVLGGDIVYFDYIDETLVDYQSIISRIRALAPDVIFVSGSVSQLGTIIRRIREQGLTQQLVSNFWIQYGDVIESAGLDSIEGSIYVSVDLNMPKFHLTLQEIDSDFVPSMVTYACFSAVAAVFDLLNSDRPPKNRAELYEALAGTEYIQLPDERVQLLGREVQYNLVPMKIIAGHSVVEAKDAK